MGGKEASQSEQDEQRPRTSTDVGQCQSVLLPSSFTITIVTTVIVTITIITVALSPSSSPEAPHPHIAKFMWI